MASTYSTNLAIELIGTGDQAGTWGVTTNTNLGTLIEQAISGYVTQAVSTGSDTTITIPNGATGVARNMYIELTGTGGTNTNLIVPSNKKLYFIFNNTSSGQVTVKVSGQTGVSVPNGKKMILVCNGTDIVNGLNYIADFGTNSFTVTNLTASSGTITNLIATTASISDASATVLRAGSATLTHLSATSASITNLALTSLTISSLSITNVSVASATVSSNLTLSGGTANGVLYLNASKVATSGSALVFDGTNLGIGAAPSYTLDVNTASATFRVRDASGGNDFGIKSVAGPVSLAGSRANTAIGFMTNDTERMRLDTSGNLGIGGTPGAALSINKQSTALSGTGNSYGVYVYPTSSGATYVDAVTSLSGTTSLNLRTYNNGTYNQLVMNSSGNVGIGTASPGCKLDVYNSAAAAANNEILRLRYTTSTTAGHSGDLNFANATGTVVGRISSIIEDGNNVGLGFSTFNSSLSQKVLISANGNVGIGGTAEVFSKCQVTGTLPTSSQVSIGFRQTGTVPSGTTATAYGYNNNLFTQAASFTLSNYHHFFAFQNTIGSGSSITNQYGYFVDASLTGATNNYGFFSNIASGSNRWNFYANGTAANYFAGAVGIGALAGGAIGDEKVRVRGTDADSFVVTWEDSTGNRLGGLYANATVVGVGSVSNVPLIFQTNQVERARIDSSGNVGIGGTASADTKVQVLGTLPTSSNTSRVYSAQATIPSGSTTQASCFNTYIGTQAASFTLANLYHYSAESQTFGAGSAVTNQYGFHVTSSLTGATNNYGFYSNIASGSNRYNFYAAGTADNYFAGRVFFTSTNATPAQNNVEGLAWTSSKNLQVSCEGDPLYVNRKGSDGALVNFLQDGTAEGDISVAGNTVSYNPFMGSHYTEIVGAIPTLKGTVLESLDELVSGKYSSQDRLPKAKVSDTVGSSAVYGVYFAPDSDPDTNDGILAAALGASWVRIAAGVTVQRGDLLESNGDGCAKVQSDDIIRSKTIGKVTSTTVADTYADGSYIVPCVLYCG